MEILAAVTGWDWFVIAVLAGRCCSACWRGLVRTVFGLAAWVLALIGTPLPPALVLALSGPAHPQDRVGLVFFVAAGRGAACSGCG